MCYLDWIVAVSGLLEGSPLLSKAWSALAYFMAIFYGHILCTCIFKGDKLGEEQSLSLKALEAAKLRLAIRSELQLCFC